MAAAEENNDVVVISSYSQSPHSSKTVSVVENQSAMAAAEENNDVVVISSSSQYPHSSQEKKGTVVENYKTKKKNATVEKVTTAANKKKKLSKDEDADEKEEEEAPLCRFPMARMWRLVRGEGGNTDVRSSREAVFLINKAAEMFLHRFAEDAFVCAVKEHRNSVSYNHLSSVVSNGKRYEFLSDFVPQKVKAVAALRARALDET